MTLLFSSQDHKEFILLRAKAHIGLGHNADAKDPPELDFKVHVAYPIPDSEMDARK